MRLDLSPERLLTAYARGIFPMADEDGVVQWLAPDPRAILELDGLEVSRSLRTTVRRGIFSVTFNQSFRAIMRACAERTDGTWISPDIQSAYGRLHELGFAHSVEAWHEGELAGGLYGVSLGGAFFGESMFHRVSNASKVALVHLVERLRARRYELLDVQFQTEHLKSLGAIEIPRSDYEQRLRHAITRRCSFVQS